MFEDGAKLDDIINAFRTPTLDESDDKKNRPVPDSAIRYISKTSIGQNDNVQISFGGQNNLGVLK